MTLYRFKGYPDGSVPSAGITLGANGVLYGTTAQDGSGSSGTVFGLLPTAQGFWTERILHSFQDNDDGGTPRSALTFHAQGNLYGSATGAGAAGAGTVFRLQPTGKTWAFGVLYEFKGSPDGAYAASSLIFDAAGHLYGTTAQGGSGQACGNYHCGTVFKAWP